MYVNYLQSSFNALIFQDDHFGEIYKGMHNRSFPFPLDQELSKEAISKHQEETGGQGTIPHLKHPHSLLELKSLSE